jgi:hypothetical protein
MPKAQVTLEWDESLGEHWMNPDNLKALLHGGTATRSELLKVKDYKHMPDPKPVPKYQVCHGYVSSEKAEMIEEAVQIATKLLERDCYNVLITRGQCVVTGASEEHSKDLTLFINQDKAPSAKRV